MQPRLIVQQKLTAFVNKYSIYSAKADGTKEELLAFAEQKKFAFREKVNFYNDENKGQVVFSFRAEKVMDVHGRYFVEDTQGSVIGMFKKDFAKSLINSSWNIIGANNEPRVSISESSQALALLRRFGGLIPLVGSFIEIIMAFFRYHFVLKDSLTERIVGRYQKTTLFRDYYLLSMDDDVYRKEDWRVLASVAVALDALQSR